MSSGSRLNPGVAPSNRLATGMGPVSQISTQSLGMLGNTAPLSSDFSMQLLHDLGIDPANITNQVFIANVRFYLYSFGSAWFSHSSLYPVINHFNGPCRACVNKITFSWFILTISGQGCRSKFTVIGG